MALQSFLNLLGSEKLAEAFSPRSLRAWLSLAVLLLLTACGSDPFVWNSTQNAISGMVVPLNPVVSLSGGALIRRSSASVTAVCPSASASLYALNSAGERVLPAVQTAPVNADGTYTFTNIRKNGIVVRKVNQLTDSYVVEVTGCNSAFARLLTATDKQDIDWGTTLITYVTGTPQAASAVGMGAEKLEALYRSLSSSGDFPSAYSALTTNPALSTQFQNSFGAAPAVLEDASPMMVDIAAPATMREGEASALTLTAVQWNPPYPRAYRWEMDGVPFASTAATSFTPSANAQGDHVLTITWGQNDGAGDIDPTKPYRQRSFPVKISNDLQPTPPPFAAVPAYVNSPNVNLRITTGAALVNCASFTHLAVTEDYPLPPADPSQFTITCSQSPTQDIPFVLSGPMGPHMLYLWALDSAGGISAVPRATLVRYDNAVPQVEILSPAPADPPFQSTVTVQGNCETISGDVSLSGDITGAPVLTACSGGTFSQTVTLTAGDGAKNISAAQTNIFGTAGSDSVAVLKDSTAPTVTLTSSAAGNTSAPIPITITFSEAVTGFDAADAVVTNGTVTAFAGSGDTYTATVTPSGEGTVNFTVPNNVGFDAAGNGNIGASLSRTFDTIQPSVTLTTAATSPTNLASVAVTATFSEPVTGLGLGSIAVSNGVASGLAGSGTSYTFNVAPTAQGAFTIQITAGAAADPAGNLSTASNTLNLDYDSVAPSATLSTAVPSLTNTSPFPITLVFSESMTGLSAGDFTVVNGTISNLVGSGTSFTFDLTPSGQGTVTLSLPAGAAQDPAANGNLASNTISRVFDSIGPNLTIATPGAGVGTNQNHIVFTGACEDGPPIYISGSGAASPASATCSSGTYSVDITFSAGEGIKNISLTQTDTAGNPTTVSRAVPYDATPPSLTFTSAAIQNQLTNTNTVTFSGACESGTNVVVAGGTDTGTVACTGAAWSYTTASQTTNGSRTYTFTQTDPGGNSVSITGTWERDATPPALTRTTPADGTRAKDSVTIAGACETGLEIYFTGAGILSPLQQTCAGGTYSQSVFFSAGDGTKAITIRQTDAAGNNGIINASFVRDNVGPNLTQTLVASPYWTNTNSATFGGACEAGLTISVTRDGTAEGTAPCPAGTWTYTTAAQTSDATRTYAFTQTDTATNATTISAQWVRRTTNPAFAFTSASAFNTSSNTVTFYGTCMTGVSVQVTNADTSSTPCSGGNWSYTTAAQTVDATRTYNFRQTDPAGNFTAISGTWTRNTNLPQLTLATTSPFYSNGNSTTFNGGCSNGLAITVSGAVNTSIACTSGTWSLPANQSSDGSYTYTFNQTDAYGNSTTVNMVWVRDTTGPSIIGMSLNSGAAVTNTSYVRVALSGSDSFTNVTKFCLKTTNTAPGASDSCWIPVNANPPGLTPALSLNLSNFSYYLGITPGVYTVYAWLQDAAGNTSSNSATLGVDRASIDYQIIYPPVLDTVFATNTNTPGYPVPSPQLNVGAGGFIYIKWRTTSSGTLGATPVKLSFTTDDVSWNTIANVANTASAGCSLGTTPADAGTTGCYRWSAPTSGFMRLKIEVTDTGGRSIAVTPPPLNTGSFKLIAGNTEPGTNTSTLSSVYLFRKQQHPGWIEPNSFVITTNGVLFLNDHVRGILSVDPADGLTKVFIPKTGVTSPDGPVSTATVRNVYGITLDYQDRLLIWDNDQIRRVDLNTAQITRIIGGGASTAATIADARNLRFEGYMPLPVEADSEYVWRTNRAAMVPLPNGDLYFGSWLDPWVEAQYKFRRYRETDANQIVTTNPTGYGHSGGMAPNIANCAILGMGMEFDPASSNINTIDFVVAEHGSSSTTSCAPDGGKAPQFWMTVYESQADGNWQIKATQPPNSDVANSWGNYHRITGRNGKLYAVRRFSSKIMEHDPVSNTWVQIIGTGIQGQCADGTPALSCDIDPQDMFVTAQNQIFFVDRGRIRTLDSSNRVVTLFGQALSSGDGGDPILARFSKLWSMALENDGRVMLYDTNRVREISADRSGLITIAGNGRPGWPRDGTLAASSPFYEGGDWSKGVLTLDPATNDLFYPILNASDGQPFIGRLNRTTGRWEKATGGGDVGTPYYNADGLPGSSVRVSIWGDFSSNWPDGFIPLGFGGGKLLVSHSVYPEPNPAWSNSMLKLFDSNDSWRQLHLAGRAGNAIDNYDFCADGTDVANCNVPLFAHINRGQYDSVDDKWLLLAGRGSYYASSKIRVVPDNNNNGAARTISTLINLPRIATNFAYWRTGGHEYIYYCSTGGLLYRYDVTSSSETQLQLPSTEMKCLPETSLDLDRVNGVLYFNFERNKLHAIGSVSAI